MSKLYTESSSLQTPELLGERLLLAPNGTKARLRAGSNPALPARICETLQIEADITSELLGNAIGRAFRWNQLKQPWIAHPYD